MAKPYIWKTADYVAAEIMGRLIGETGLTLHALQERSGDTIGYNRFRDIQKGLKAPMRLSEFLTICDVCQVDAAETLRAIRDEARRREENQKDISTMSDEERIAVAKREYAEKPWELAALHDPNKKIEMMGDAGPDWDDPA